MLDAIQAALQTRHVFTHAVSAEAAVECVAAAAPDLVLLLGDASHDGGATVLAALGHSPITSVVPVAILTDQAALDERLQAFRHGATAVIPKSASVDAIAEQVEQLVREIPEREGSHLGNIGEATLRDLVDTLSHELRTGILTVRSESGSDDDAVRLVLGGGKPLAEAIDDFVARLRGHVVHAEPLHYEFDEHAGGTLQLLGADVLGEDAEPPAHLETLRIVIVDENAARADAVAQEVRSHGASAVVTNFDATELQFARLRQLDPAIILVSEQDLHGPGYALLRRMRHDTRLRWASLLLVRWDDIWSESKPPEMERMLRTLAELDAPEAMIRERAKGEESFDVRLEATGPARLARALASCQQTLRATVYHPRVFIQLDVSDGVIASASGYSHANPDAPFAGSTAISALMVVSSGRVRVEHTTLVGNPNVMQTVDVALNVADQEPAPIAASVPAPSGPPSAPAPAASPKKRSALPWVTLTVGAVGFVGAVIAAVFIWSTDDGRTVATSAEPTPSTAPVASASPPPSSASAVATTATAPAASADAGAPDDAGEAAPPVTTTGVVPFIKETSITTPSCEELAGKLESVDPLRANGAADFAVLTARRHLVKGNVKGAQSSYCRAAILDPSRTAATLGLVRLLLIRRDGARALDWARRAVTQSPQSEHAQALLGDALARTGDIEGAKTAWTESAGVSADDLQAVRRLATRFMMVAVGAMKRSEHERGERFYRRTAYLDPKSAIASSGVARALVGLGDLAPAIEWARRAVTLDPESADHQITLGDMLIKADEKDAARAAYKEAARLAPANAIPKRRLHYLGP